jgi:hypothetical protein
MDLLGASALLDTSNACKQRQREYSGEASQRTDCTEVP